LKLGFKRNWVLKSIASQTYFPLQPKTKRLITHLIPLNHGIKYTVINQTHIQERDKSGYA